MSWSQVLTVGTVRLIEGHMLMVMRVKMIKILLRVVVLMRHSWRVVDDLTWSIRRSDVARTIKLCHVKIMAIRCTRQVR